MRLLAISDLHLGHPANRDRLSSIGASPEDWLILAGDVGETEAHLTLAFEHLTSRFAKLIWVPGNHELWTVEQSPKNLRGKTRYEALVALARRFGVITPEDPYPEWPQGDRPMTIVPIFTLYDYSFRPDEVPLDRVIEWAAQDGVACADEFLLHPEPYRDRAAWCAARVAATEARLTALPESVGTILVSHFPLFRSHAKLPRVPRFSPWCGTRATETWTDRFRAHAVIYGHLHIRRSFEERGVQFHEVSLGYPGQWDQKHGMASYLRVIL